MDTIKAVLEAVRLQESKNLTLPLTAGPKHDTLGFASYDSTSSKLILRIRRAWLVEPAQLSPFHSLFKQREFEYTPEWANLETDSGIPHDVDWFCSRNRNYQEGYIFYYESNYSVVYRLSFKPAEWEELQRNTNITLWHLSDVVKKVANFICSKDETKAWYAPFCDED